MKKKFLVLDFRFFVGDVISGEGFWLFWLRLPALGPDARWKYFDQVFIGN